MKCSRCSTQWDSAELSCPFCGQITEDAENNTPVKLESSSEVRCLHCTSMVSTREKFCNSCGREQTFRPQAKVSSTSPSSTGAAFGWGCFGCAVVALIAFLIIQAVASTFFKSLVGA